MIARNIAFAILVVMWPLLLLCHGNSNPERISLKQPTLTSPSFFPVGLSSSTPIHHPLGKDSTLPTKRTVAAAPLAVTTLWPSVNFAASSLSMSSVGACFEARGLAAAFLNAAKPESALPSTRGIGSCAPPRLLETEAEFVSVM